MNHNCNSFAVIQCFSVALFEAKLIMKD